MSRWFRPTRAPGGRHRTGTPAAEIIARQRPGHALEGAISTPLRARRPSVGEINPGRPNLERVDLHIDHEGHPMGAGPDRRTESETP